MERCVIAAFFIVGYAMVVNSYNNPMNSHQILITL